MNSKGCGISITAALHHHLLINIYIYILFYNTKKLYTKELMALGERQKKRNEALVFFILQLTSTFSLFQQFI